MDSMSYRNNRTPQRNDEPVAAPPQPQPSVAAPHTAHAAVSKRSRGKIPRSKKPIIVAIIVAIVVLVAVAAGLFLTKGMRAGTGVDSSKYQAVFFTNGQVYFGKLTTLNGEYFSLKNVYYLQTKTTGDESKTSPQSATKQDASNVELIKLGNEIHGPDDEMVISRDQVLFFENLKPAGTVSQTITNFQKQKK